MTALKHVAGAAIRVTTVTRRSAFVYACFGISIQRPCSVQRRPFPCGQSGAAISCWWLASARQWRQRMPKGTALHCSASDACLPSGPMCGRYTHKLSWKQIVELYRLTVPEEPPETFKGESYNVAPTDIMPIVRPAGNGPQLVMASWGLALL